MASSSLPDPLQMWRNAVNRFEKDINSLATGSTKSQPLVRLLHQFSNASLGLQQTLEKTLDAYLRRANLPSHNEVAELAESLRRIEDKLDGLLHAEKQDTAAPRPARTRRPPRAAPARSKEG